MNFITDYNELDTELKSKLNPDTKQTIDSFFKIDDSSKEGRHITIEKADPEYIEKMLNKSLEEGTSIEPTLDTFKQKVINIYHKILKRSPNNIELIHHSNMLKYEVSTDEEIENILKNSDDYKRIQRPVHTMPVHTIEIVPAITQVPQLEQQVPQSEPDPEQHYIEIIKRVYDNELKREADEAGISTYLRHMKKGMTEEKLRNAIRNSPEYRQNFGTYVHTQPTKPIQPIQSPDIPSIQSIQVPNININISPSIPLPIVYCMMGTNRLNEIKPYIESTLPYINKFIFIDGESEDGTLEYLKSLEKVEYYIYPWQDRFSEQRNHYLEKLKDRNYNGWVITSDSDEHYPAESLKQIKDIIPELEAKGYNGIKVQVVDIEVDNDNFNKIISRNINQYWKPLVFKFHPNLRYEGEPHETLTGYPIKWYKSNILYEHRRSKLHILQRATENFFVSNSNRWSEKWAEFRYLCTTNNLLNFKDYWKLFEKHELPKEIEEWIYKHKDDSFDSGDSELREMYILYNEVLPERMKKKPDNITTSPIQEKQEPKTTKPDETSIRIIQELLQENTTLKVDAKRIIQENNEIRVDAQRFIQENSALRAELNKALIRIGDLTHSSKSSKNVQPSSLSEKAKEVIYEIVPPDNIYIVRISKSEADIIENRDGEAIYRRINIRG